MIKFPYGICDFYKIITEGYFYVDRTDKIPLIEESGQQLLFLRPRRFGKSLLLTTLENYYDLAKADQFEQLFGHLAIGQNPTPLHNQYLVMRWDFSVVKSYGPIEGVEQALHSHLNVQITNFTLYYQQFLDEKVRIDYGNAVASFESLLGVVQRSPYRFYLLIDEYDNFANEILMGGRPDSRRRYEELLHGEGIFKTVFKAIKSGGAGRGLDRAFITGVSPVVMSDATSGYNIAENIYLEPAFNDLCGFWESEIETALQQIVAECDFPVEKAAEALETMRTFYNGYTFSSHIDELIYNPTLALYYMKHFQRHCQAPRNLLDSNFAMDRAKISYISQLPGGEPLVLDAVETPGLVVPMLADRFGVAEMSRPQQDPTFMASLLYYLGVLTLGGETPSGELLLTIPNLLVRKLYLERVQEMFLPDSLERYAGYQAAKLLYQRGEMQPLCNFVQERYFKALDNRDYCTANELTIKIAFLTLLFNDLLYVMDSETALERSYADLTMIIRPGKRHYQLWDILIEFKYLGLKELDLSGAAVRATSTVGLRALPQVAKKLAQAQAQLQNYRTVLQARYGDALRLRAYAVVSLGFDRLVWEEIKAD